MSNPIQVFIGSLDLTAVHSVLQRVYIINEGDKKSYVKFILISLLLINFFRLKILLNGMGGSPNLFINNIKSDLNGAKMIVLQNSSNAQFFNRNLEFKNTGRIPGFILIKTSSESNLRYG